MRQRLRTFPTTSGALVELWRSNIGLIVVKRPAPGSDEAVRHGIETQGRQLQILSSVRPGGPFPTVIEADSHHLVLRYVPGVTLRDSRSVLSEADLLPRIAEAIATVFDLSCSYPAGAVPPPGVGFLYEEFARRMVRLKDARAHPVYGLKLRQAIERVDGGELLAAIDVGLLDGTIEGLDRDLAPQELGFGVHGDLTPQNIVCSADTGQLTLIDPRGTVRWSEGLPWWDPIWDLAASIVFHGVVDELGGNNPPDRLAGRLLLMRSALINLCDTDPRVRRWTATDSHWTERADMAILIRMLGNIPIQCEYGGLAGADRAAAIYAACIDWLGVASRSMTERLGGARQ